MLHVDKRRALILKSKYISENIFFDVFYEGTWIITTFKSEIKSI